MSSSEDRTKTRDPWKNFNDEIVGLQRGFILSQVEGLAAMTDVARRFLSEALDTEPMSNRTTWGDVIRDTPDAMASATSAAANDLAGIPKRMMDTFYAESGASRPQRERAGGGASGGVERTTTPEGEIVQRARAYLHQFPGGGALIGSVVNNVALETGYPQDIVRTMVLRHFVCSGPFVREQTHPQSSPQQGQVLSSMAQHLSSLGYTDLRYDFPLRAFPDMTQVAALVAFEDNKPVVLCYPTEEQGVQDPTVREAARFQAAAVDPAGFAQFVWVSDGAQDYFFDVERDMAVANLPHHRDSSSVV